MSGPALGGGMVGDDVVARPLVPPPPGTPVGSGREGTRPPLGDGPPTVGRPAEPLELLVPLVLPPDPVPADGGTVGEAEVVSSGPVTSAGPGVCEFGLPTPGFGVGASGAGPA